MNAEQKRAWVILGVGTASVAGYVALVPFVGAWAALAFGLYGLLFLVPLIGCRQPADERDKSIGRRATVAGGMASYLAFLLGCQCVWWAGFAWQGREQVSVHLVQIITAFGVVVFFSVRSIVILIFYGRHVESVDA
jgi:hypothetical protein